MKLTTAFFILLILFTCSHICFSQEEQKAVLYSAVGNVVEEEFAAHFDAFMQELARNPNLQGYAVIHPKLNSTEQNFKRERGYERFIKNRISIVKFDKSRINIVRSNDKDEIEVEFWTVPPGAEKPFPIEEKWAETLPDLTKPFVFGISYFEEIFASFIPEFYADHIRNNANLRGHIVIFNKSKIEASYEAKRWLKILTKEYKIPRNRLKVFFAKNDGSIDAEFWLVPQKKNK